MEKASLEDALEEQQETRVSLEEKLESIEESHNEIIAKLIKERDHAIAKYKVAKKENASFKEELSKFSSSISNVNDACYTNSTYCEASILKENVELKAQLVLLTSKYGKLEEINEKLSSSNEDLLSSHSKLRLALEAITTKVTSSDPHVDNGTTSRK